MGNYDVIVIGGGPAGSTAARGCAERGFKTLLIDKELFPRYKPCGGALSFRTINSLGFEIPQGMIEAECKGVNVYYKGEMSSYEKEGRVAVMVSREKFDNLLFEMAKERGCMTLTGERVVSVDRGGEYIKVNTEKGAYSARFVVGADGANSVVSKFINGNGKEFLSAMAFVSKIEVHETLFEKEFLSFYFGNVYGGYGWVFPHGRYLSAGIWGLDWLDSKPVDSMKRFLSSNNFSTDNIRGHKMPLWDRRRKICSERVLLAGDAGGFVDSFSGEGISNAILSGRIAAESIADSLENGESAGDNYKKRCNSLFVNNLKYSMSFTRLIFRFPEFFLKRFIMDNNLLRQYIEDQASNTSYKEYIKYFVGMMRETTPSIRCN
ncbi:MAG: geranylgeranyl reductase family protein [Nitrospinae bacterium]|nr:geranylgeranyl reductase family protein [Nitrospinota bacterium]